MILFDTIYNQACTNVYRSIHILLGGILAINSINFKYRIGLFLAIIIYNFGQLLFHVRYFVFKNTFLQGNSLKHTINKLSDYALGYGIVWLVNQKN